MITENLSTLKIHKLTQEQYDRELAAGRIDESALYLTPEEEDSNIFIATKDVTTFAEIQEAVNAGKYVVLNAAYGYWPLFGCTNYSAEFRTFYNNNYLYKVCSVSSDGWSDIEYIKMPVLTYSTSTPSKLAYRNLRAVSVAGEGSKMEQLYTADEEDVPYILWDANDWATKDEADNIFYAEYGVTTNTEMAEALDAGKLLVCVDGRKMAVLRGSLSDKLFEFNTGNEVYRNSYGTWSKESITAESSLEMKGATETEDGSAGFVPMPFTNERNFFLRGDGTWAENDALKVVEKEITMPSASRWRAITYGNGKFVAIANDNNNSNVAAYSTDGITWTATTLPQSANWTSVTYGDGKFIAVSNGVGYSAYSIDGITWIEMYMPEDCTRFADIDYGNGKFVAIDNTTYSAVYSTDGINWTKSTLPNLEAGYNKILYGNGKFIVYTINYNMIAYSSDCITWTEIDVGTAGISSLAYGNGKFVGTSSLADEAIYSFDGINWNLTTMPADIDWQSIAYGNKRFVAIARASNIVAYSNDGINWEWSTMPSNLNWYDITFGNGKFVVIVRSDLGTTVFTYSIDGINWETKSYRITKNNTDITNDFNVALELYSKQNKITGTAGDFVVIGSDGNVTTKTIANAEEVGF